MSSLLSLSLSFLYFFASCSAASSLSTTSTQISASIPAPSSTCDDSTTSYCPRCDGNAIKSGEFGNYEVYCGRLFTHATYFQDMQGTTVSQCIYACTQSGICDVPVIAPDGRCILAELQRDENGDPIEDFVEESGWAVLLPRFTGAIPPASGSGFGSSLTISSIMSETMTLAASSSTTASSTPCEAHSVSCPACANKYVEDDLGTTYHVFCDSSLYSEQYYSVQRWLTPAGCMAECDNYTWCGGANFEPPGNCELARGQDVFPQRKLGTTAFLPVDLSYTPEPPHLSAFPTGDFTSVRTTTAKPSFTKSTSSSSTSTRLTSEHPSPTTSNPATPTVEPCSLGNIYCPRCDGATVVDGFNETYRVQCNFQPICDDITGRSKHTSQNSCMEHCDADQTCLAAIWKRGHCDLCQGSLEGLLTYESPHEYVVFIAEPLLEPPKPTFSTYPPPWSSHHLHSLKLSTSTQALMSLHSLPTQTSTVTITPVPISPVDIGTVKCPSNDNLPAIDSSDGRHFNIQCDTGLGAAEHHFLSASNLAACAASCTGGCNGFHFGHHTRCGLFTSISVVSSKPGVTAGVHITNPPAGHVEVVATITSANMAARL